MALLGIAAAAVLAQAQAEATPTPQAAQTEPQRASGLEPASPSSGSGVIVYPPEFFAESQPNNALDMVNRLPGFTLESVDTSVRGFAGAGGNVLVDGQRPASKSDALSDVLARIPANTVERIELIRGGAPGINMQGKAVVVNVVRRRVDSFQQLVSGSTFYFVDSGKLIGGYRYEATRQAGARTWEFAFGRSVSMDDSVGAGFRERRGPAGELLSFETTGTEGDGGGNNGKASLKTPFAGGEFRASASLSHSLFKFDRHYYTPDRRTDAIGKEDSLTGEFGVNYDRELSERWAIETLALQKRGRSEVYEDESAYEEPSDTRLSRNLFTSEAETGESIARGLLRFRASDTLSFEGGGEAAFNFREGHIAFNQNGADIDLPSSDVRVEERRGELFALANWRPLPELSLEAGSRFESSTISQSGDTTLERSFFYPKPRLLLTWSPNESDQLRLRVEREVGQLRFSDFVSSSNLSEDRVVAGNPELEPDKTWVFEGAAERRFWGGGAVVLLLRHRAITDVIDRSPVFVDDDGDGDVDSVFDAPGNIGDGTRDELEFNLTLPLSRLGVEGGEFKVSAVLRKSEVTDPTTGETREISGLRHDNVTLNYRHDLPGRKLTLEAGYYHGWEEFYFRFSEISRLEIRNFLEAAVEYKPTPKLNFRFEANNLSPFTFIRERRIYAGPRNTSPLSVNEVFQTQSQVNLFFRARRTFGD
jgi:hypothetical protein